MKCRFVVYSVPWEKRKELQSHECVGLEEKILSCERSNPVKQVSKPEQNVVEEMFIETKVCTCTCINKYIIALLIVLFVQS